jgi:chemotaxis protein MotB
MDRKGNVIVIRRKTVVAGGHHGGAWKVAYADFVTAMMAFFLLMWLLSTTDQQTRLGLADYFSPTIPIHESRSGGNGPFDGESMFSQDVLARDETGQTGDPARMNEAGAQLDQASDESLYDIEKALLGGSGDAMEADPLLAHIRTRVTDEGLIIEVFDIEGSPLFQGDGTTPNPIFGRLVAMIGRVLSRTANPVAVAGHLASGDADPWTVSTARAQLSRQLLEAAGIADARLDRVTGRADRASVVDDPAAARNRRVEITLLRRFQNAE